MVISILNNIVQNISKQDRKSAVPPILQEIS